MVQGGRLTPGGYDASLDLNFKLVRIRWRVVWMRQEIMCIVFYGDRFEVNRLLRVVEHVIDLLFFVRDSLVSVRLPMGTHRRYS